MQQAKFQKINYPTGNTRGMAIVEVLVAIGILSLLIVTFGKAIHSINQMNRISELRTRAQELAQQSIEVVISRKPELFLHNYGGDFNLPASDPWIPQLPADREPVPGEPNFARKINIADARRDTVTNDISAGGTIVDDKTKIITATVWYTENGRVHELNLRTILTKWEN
jgi:type II secretory pathway pseudopilin PulG